MTSAKWELKKEHPQYYRATAAPQLVELPPVPYLSILGQGAPEGDEFKAKLQALYGLAYTLKMQLKRAGQDFTVGSLEGLWWADYDPALLADPAALWTIPRAMWCWRLLIPQPSFVTAEQVDLARQRALAKKQTPLLAEIRFETLHEKRCVQILHIGPFANEPESILTMRTFMQARGLVGNGLHHELYLSDFRRTAPEKLRTILRQPVKGG